MSNIVEENHLADNTKICYTYDSLNRVTKRTIKNECEQIISVENYSYDAAGNITDAPNSCFIYDANNRLTKFNGNSVTYDMDGNMLSDGCSQYKYDSANRLIKADGHTYTYNAEDVRIRNLCSDADTTYTYNTNCKLSQLLQKTTNGIITKYVYGLGLIGEEKENCFKTYHFDYRGSTVAITDINGNITDTFKYDTYGKLISRTGNSFVIFGYNGRDGVVTDKNGLIYMRARYYSPEMRRFINADVLHGEISDSTSLNRYSYVNGNPVSFVDPFGLSADNDRGTVDINLLFDILKKINRKEDAKIATNMLASTLDQLLSFKNLFTLENGIEYSSYIDMNTSVRFSTSMSSGKGSMNVSSVLSEQIEILGSLSFNIENTSVYIDDNGLISIGYSCEYDDYSKISASISGMPGVSLSVDYTITTTDKYDNSVSTSVGMTHWNNLNNQNKAPATVPVLVSVPKKEKSTDWGKVYSDLGIAIGATAIAVVAIAETVGTGGIGIWNDGFAVGGATTAWVNASQSISVLGQQIYSSASNFWYWLTNSSVFAT